MAKRCPEEFNPWPPFVDIFASVILVMLLFLLITIVNIGYYAQFKHKVSYTASVVTEAPIQSEDQSKVKQTQTECSPIKVKDGKLIKDGDFSFHKITALTLAASTAKNSLFEGGKADGNAVSYATQKDKKEFTNQELIQKGLLLTINFQDKEIFLNSKIKRKIKQFLNTIKRRSKRAIFTIYVSDPTYIISSTISKQISLGRVLNTKSLLHKSNIKSKNIHLNLQKHVVSTNKYGDIRIEAFIP